MLTNTALKLLRRLLGPKSRAEGPYAGNPVVLDGNTAVAVTEAAVCEAAALGASLPADGAELAWRAEQQRHGTNLAGAALTSHAAEGPRGQLATAIGQALAGVRATAFLSGPDLAAARDLLQAAAGRRVPLVLHLGLRALAGQGPALAGSHEALHLAADAGCFVLMAANVQEAADFALIARRAAEQALVPGLVAMDGVRTALALQEVRLAPAELADGFLGAPGDQISPPTEAQKMLFGETRRRVPRWHDPDRPVLLGGLQPAEAWGLGRAAGEVFFDAHLEGLIEAAFDEFARQTGRAHRPVSGYHLEDAELVLVAQGSAVETAEAVAGHLRKTKKMKVGVLGIRCLRPFPGAEAARLLGSGARVCVLERLDTPLAGDPPLLRELRVALDRALENGHFGDHLHPGYPALRERHRPRFISAVYSLGGLPLRAADLVALCEGAESLRRSRVFLGLDFAPATSPYPKRQVLLDRLRRSYPDIADMGLRGAGPQPDLRPEGGVSLALYRLTGGPEKGLAVEAAALLQGLLGGGLRSRPGHSAEAWGGPCVDRIGAAPEALRDPGDVPVVDLALLAADPALPGLLPEEGLRQGSAVLVQSVLPDDALWAHLSAGMRRTLKETGAALFRVPAPEGAAQGQVDYLLGALCAVLLETGRLDTTPRRLLGAREVLLEGSADGEQRLERFEAGLAAPHRIDLAALAEAAAPPAAATEDEAPTLVRRLGTIDDAYDSLPRFWDQVGVLYRNGDTPELAPDPYLALNAVPPLSAGFRDLSRVREQLPQLDPALCTGCGACWSGCPDGAVGAVALTPARLLDTGIQQVGADALRPVASKIAAGMAELARGGEAGPATVAGLLGAAFDRIKAKLPFPDERKAAIGQGVEAVSEALGCLRPAVTGPLFDEPEAGAKGSGELLFLAIDADACKGCGICVRACEPGALESHRQGVQSLLQTRRERLAWDLLPDTGEETVSRLAGHAEVGVLAAGLLSRATGQVLAGGDGAEPGSGAKLALRLALAAAESHQGRKLAGWRKQVDETRERIAGLIRDLLTDALPADDLDALERGLAGAGGGQADIASFIGSAEDAIGGGVDARRLRRLVDLARGLGDLSWRLAQGRQGLGRARVGLVLAPGRAAGWAAAFPHNSCAGPVVLDPTGDGVQLAAGLLEGQLRQATEGLILMRKARLELEHPEEAARLWGGQDALTWRDLEAEERALCPPLLLVGDGGVLAGCGLAQLAWLLNGDLPVKLLVLADLDLGLAAPAEADLPLAGLPDATLDLGLLALSRPMAWVAQSALGMPGHLAPSLERFFEYRGPALLHLHAPSPEQHGFAADATLERSRAAVAARVFPLFRYDPEGEGVFGSRLDLAGNPEPLQSFASATPVHWALGERRFAGLFESLAEDAPEPVALADYLALDAKGRRRKTPYVERGANGGEPQKLGLDPRLVAVCEARGHAWRTLQELAGLVTPFTARVRQEAEAAVAAERQAELAAQAAEYGARIRGLQEEMQEQTRNTVRERLLQMAGYGQTSTGTDA